MLSIKKVLNLSITAGVIGLLSTFPSQYVEAAEDTAMKELLMRNWKPAIEIAGEGEQAKAVKTLRSMQDLQATMLEFTVFHKETEDFINGLWSSFESFNLKGFHQLLPEQSGSWRKLNVVGHLDRHIYRYGPTEYEVGIFQESGEPVKLGDIYIQVKAKEIENKIFGRSYVLKTDLDMGIPGANWTSITDAGKEVLKIAVNDDSIAMDSSSAMANQANRYKGNVKNLSSNLDEQDIEILAPLWASYPHLWEQLSKVATVKDMVINDVAGKPYKHLNAIISIQPEKMEASYPKLAKFLKKIGYLFHVNIDLNSDEGRYFHALLDSKTLTLTFEAYVHEGLIVPINKAGKVELNVPNRKFGEPWNFVADVNAELEMLGVKATMSNMKTEASYTTRKDGALIATTTKEMPDLKVTGMALGIMPTALIDALMPSNIETIMSAFLKVIFDGDQGKGVVVDVNYTESAGNQIASLETKINFVGLDNIFMRLGMGIVNDRIIPDDKVTLEIKKLLFDTQDAFRKDLDNYSKIVLSPATGGYAAVSR